MFNYNALPSKPLHFKISVLPKPQLIKANLHLKSNAPNPVYEFGEPIAGSNVWCVFKDEEGFLWIASNNLLYQYDGENLYLYNLGLIHSYIDNMLEDNKGQIWFGTSSNIYGVDGEGIYVIDSKHNLFKHLSVNEGLSDNIIPHILLDKAGRIWATTAGVDIIDDNAHTIKHFDSKQGLSSNVAISLMQDGENNMWITTLFGGLNIIDFKNERIKHLNKSNGLINDSLIGMIRDKKNNIWLGGLHGAVTMIDAANGFIINYNEAQGLSKRVVSSLMCDDKNNLWVGTSNNEGISNGIEILNCSTQSTKTITTLNGLNSNFINKIRQYSKEQIWVATDNGLNLINPTIQHTGKEEITALTESNDGKIWIATTNEGIDIFDTAIAATRNLNATNGLAGNEMDDVDKAGEKILAKGNSGLYIINSKDNNIEHYGKGQGLSTDTLGHTLFDKNGSLWICNHSSNKNKVVDVLDLKNKTIQHFDSTSGLNSGNIYSITQDKLGRLWFSFIDNNKVHIIDSGYKSVRTIDSASGLKCHNIINILADDNGNTWIGTDSGLYIINIQKDSVWLLTTQQGLLNNVIIALNKYKNSIYASTLNGLTIITPAHLSNQNKWEIQSFGKNLGFTKNVESANSDIVTKQGKFIWGDAGMTFLSKQQDNINSPSNYITAINIFDQPQYFADNPWKRLQTTDTLTGNEKNKTYLKNQLPENILFSSGNTIQFDSVSGPYNLPVNLNLPYYQNYIQFHFIQKHVGVTDTIWYRYKLEGIDKNWSEKTFATWSQNYLNLPPGKYTFEVSSVSVGEWNTPAKFSFIISPPWWKTWWAYTLYMLLLGSAIWLLTTYRSRNLQRQNKLLEIKVNQRTEQLNKSLQELKSTQAQLIQSEKMASLGELTAGIAHEIQNPLNFVNNFSEVNKEMIDEATEEINKGNLDEVKNILNDIRNNEEKINHHGKRADAIVKGMLQHSRLSTGTQEPTDINALCDEYLRLSYHGLRAKDKNFNADFTTDFDNSIGKINIVRQDIGRVLLNLYNNAFYATSERLKAESLKQNTEYKPAVSVQTKKTDNKIEIRVNDNGNGIPLSIKEKIFQPFFTTKPTGQGTGLGLSLAYDIITKEHNGTIKVESKEGGGSKFIIQLSI